MNHSLSLLRNRSDARRLIFFNLLLFTGMWSSKTVHPLWFEASGSSLLLFGWSYSAMAITGSFSFAIGYFGDRIGVTHALRIGTVLYTVGLILRFFTHSPILAILSGLLSGLGASTILVCIRPWIFSWATQDELPMAVALRNSSMSIGSAFGILLAGWIPSLIHPVTISYPIILLVAAAITLSSILFIPNVNPNINRLSKTQDNKQQESTLKVLDRHFFLTIGVIFFGTLSGLYTSMLTPYFPVILSNFGLSLGVIGTLLAINNFSQAIIGSIISRFSGKYKYLIFLIAGTVLSIITLLIAIHLHWIVIIIAILLRGVFAAASLVTGEIIQMTLYPKQSMSLYFGFTQTGFLIGDSIGGIMGGWLYSNYGISAALFLSATLIFINSLFFPLFALIITKQTDEPIS